jgi:hypothetical protein
MSKKPITCPWCGAVSPEIRESNTQGNSVVERRCGSCEKVLAAYAVGEGDFLPRIRVYPNK